MQKKKYKQADFYSRRPRMLSRKGCFQLGVAGVIIILVVLAGVFLYLSSG